MSEPKEATPALLFVAGLFSENSNYVEIIKDLEKEFGNIVFSALKIDFFWSHYYEKEMGENLKRYFFVFYPPVKRTFLVKSKKITDKLEKKYAINLKRTVNLDAGIITKENILLATNKPFFHRIYLQNGVYSEVTLFYKDDSYRGIEYWTYPEYSSSSVIGFFNTARGLFLLGGSA